MSKRIVVINPGATTTKLAYYEGESEVWRGEITYTSDELKDYKQIFDQFDLRLADITRLLENNNVQAIDAAVGRGGLIGPVQPGAIIVDQAVMDKLEHDPVVEHASNLGAKLAHLIAEQFGHTDALAYIYDPVTVDSISDVAQITGLKAIKRQSIGHHLNMRAVARKATEAIKKPYEEANVIVVHLGGGSTASAHQQGQIIDFVSDDEIMFSAERSGGLPLKAILPLIKELGVDAFKHKIRSEAGLQDLCGTKDLRIVQEKIDQGDENALLAVQALALGISKCIGALATSLNGEVDVIAITGGMAHSPLLQTEIKQRINFIAPLEVFAGEFEMSALALGGLRVLQGDETATIYR